jgi:hypothetical protein
MIRVLVPFSQHQPGRTAVNATPANAATAPHAADRTDRLLAMLHRLAEIGMQLAERAAAQALAEPLPRPEGVPRSRRHGPDPSYVFVRLSRFVRETVALEARLAAGKLPRVPRAQATPKGVDASAKPARHAPSANFGLRQQLDAFIAGSGAAAHHERAVHVAGPALSRNVSLVRDAAKRVPNHLMSEIERLAAEATATNRAITCPRTTSG